MLTKVNMNERRTRKTRQNTRKSPNSKLLNAAWPKPPTNPTRKSHIKAVNHEPFTKCWEEWRNKKSEFAVEDMEVDETEVHSHSTDNESPTASKGVSPSNSGVTHNKDEEIKASSSSSQNDKQEERHLISTRRSDQQNLESTSRKSESQKMQSKRLSASPMFIVIHASQVACDTFKGAANSPVKVYADRFMVQMEEETTKKEIMFRVLCKDILSLKMSLNKKPFMIQFTTNTVHYTKGGPATKSKAKTNQKSTICLHLHYEEKVPLEIKENLKELFQIRLAHQNLWSEEDEEEENGESTDSKETEELTELEVKGNNTEKNDATSNATDSKVEEVVSSTSPIKQKPSTSNPHSTTTLRSTSGKGKYKAPSIDKRKIEFVQDEEKQPPTTPPKQSERIILTPGRKRTPSKAALNSAPVVSSSTDRLLDKIDDVKVLRRCNNEGVDFLEERVRTLEHEAAHYQMLSAQQRMIIQSIENDARKAEEDKMQMKQEQNVELTRIMNNLSFEKELVKALQSQIESYRKELDVKDRIVQEKNNALQVRENTILELRSRERRISTTEKEEKRKEDMVPLVQLEECRTQLEQAERSSTQLLSQMEHLQSERNTSESELIRLQQQFENLQNECRDKTATIERLTVDYRASQNLADEKNQQILQIEAQNNRQIGDLRSDLSSSHITNEELQSELQELRNQVEELGRTDYSPSISSGSDVNGQAKHDWILERGEINLTEKVIGNGAWGKVKVGKFRGTEVAVKQIHLVILSPHNRRLFEREMAIASRCRHPCLVQFIGATNDDGTPLFVMELMHTDLRTVLSQQPLNSTQCVSIGYDVLRAIVYLHKSKPVPIIHRDISSSNVLLSVSGDNTWSAKLSDYGAANFLRLSMTRHPGALLYSAPEASTMDQTTKLDVYSFGVLFCEMCIRELPVPENRREQIRNVADSDYRILINNCLRRDVAKRMESDAVMQVFEGWMTSKLQVMEKNTL